MPRRVDKKEKKTAILESAIRVFAKKGISNTKMKDISEAAGIGKGTLYEYFTSKDDIFNNVFHYFMERINLINDKRFYHVYDPVEKLSAFIMAQIDVIESDIGELIDIMLDFWAEGIRNKETSSIFKLTDMYEEYRKMVKSILDECIEKEQIRRVNTDAMSSIIIGTLDGIMVQHILGINNFDIRESITLFKQTILKGLKD